MRVVWIPACAAVDELPCKYRGEKIEGTEWNRCKYSGCCSEKIEVGIEKD